MGTFGDVLCMKPLYHSPSGTLPKLVNANMD
jgi:hypothetical protein